MLLLSVIFPNTLLPKIGKSGISEKCCMINIAFLYFSLSKKLLYILKNMCIEMCIMEIGTRALKCWTWIKLCHTLNLVKKNKEIEANILHEDITLITILSSEILLFIWKPYYILYIFFAIFFGNFPIPKLILI